MHTKLWLENLKGKDHSEDQSIDEKNRSLGNKVGRCELYASGSE
jgi:hypothetical protein